MAALDQNTPRPTEIKLHQKSRILEISFADGKTFQLPCEFLRVYSPSAEVRGHGPGQAVLQIGKKNVEITYIDPVGTYAIQLFFSDGHDTGIYSWTFLYDYGTPPRANVAALLREIRQTLPINPAASPVGADFLPGQRSRW